MWCSGLYNCYCTRILCTARGPMMMTTHKLLPYDGASKMRRQNRRFSTRVTVYFCCCYHSNDRPAPPPPPPPPQIRWSHVMGVERRIYDMEQVILQFIRAKVESYAIYPIVVEYNHIRLTAVLPSTSHP